MVYLRLLLAQLVLYAKDQDTAMKMKAGLLVRIVYGKYLIYSYARSAQVLAIE